MPVVCGQRTLGTPSIQHLTGLDPDADGAYGYRMTNTTNTYSPAYFRRFVGRDTRFRFQLKGFFFPLDGTIEAVSGPKVLVKHQNGEKWLIVSRTHAKCDVQSVDILGAIV